MPGCNRNGRHTLSAAAHSTAAADAGIKWDRARRIWISTGARKGPLRERENPGRPLRTVGKINRTRASTTEGLIAKAKVAAHDGRGDPSVTQETHVSIVRDLRAMGRARRVQS